MQPDSNKHTTIISMNPAIQILLERGEVKIVVNNFGSSISNSST